MFAQRQESMNAVTKEWEKAAATWWDATLRDPKTLEALGTNLNAMCTLKERTDRQLEELWGRYRLPSAADVERLHERLASIEDSLERVEDSLERSQESK